MTVLAAPTRPYGPIVGNTDGLSTFQNLMGGEGTCRLKRLVSGFHVVSTLDCMEHVVLLAGASCGRHTHTRTAEIYYVLGGAGVMHLAMDGEPPKRWEVVGGDLITAPLHTSHTIAALPDTSIAILVVEVLPGDDDRRPDPTRIAVRDLLADQAAGRADGVRVTTVELARHLTGAWGPFQVAALEPAARLGPHTTRNAEQFLYLVRGRARFEFGNQQEAGTAGLYVAVPPGVPWTIANDSTHNLAEVAITEVGVSLP